MNTSDKKPPGIQSVEIAGFLLQALVDEPGPAPLRRIAAQAKMTPTKARRYLVSLIRSGLASQDRETGLYELGPLAISIGMAALNRFDVIRDVGRQLAEIRDQIDETVFLSVRGQDGATIIQFKENPDPISLRARIGATLPLLTTATGWIFISFDPVTEEKISNNISTILDTMPDSHRILGGHSNVSDHATEIRSAGYVHMDSVFQAGISAISVPVLGIDSELMAALTVVLPRERAAQDHIDQIATILKAIGNRSVL